MSIFQTVCLEAKSPTNVPSVRASDRPEFTAGLDREAVEGAQKRTVIVVNDNDKILRLIGEVLGRSGFVVHLASSSASTLNVIDSLPSADLLLIDTGMPDIDGIVLADMVKARCPTIQVLYMTDHATSIEAKFGVRHGPTLRMPFLADELVVAVRQSI